MYSSKRTASLVRWGHNDERILKSQYGEKGVSRLGENWYSKIAGFHKISNKQNWFFGPDEVIAYLVHQKHVGAPAWKRLKIAQGLALYKAEFLNNRDEQLIDVCNQLKLVNGASKTRHLPPT